MANDQLMAPLPEVTLQPGMQIIFEAIDPTTGAAVAGVKIASGSIYADETDASAVAELKPGPFMLVSGPDA